MARPMMYWTFSPPPGLTPIRQLPHKWQEATRSRLREAAAPFAQLTISNIRAEWSSFYPQGWGTIPRTLKSEVQDSRDGISIKFAAGGRHLPLITALGGGLFEPGAQFVIEPTGEGENTYLAFFWKRKGKWARFLKVVHPGWDVDFLAESFEIMSESFQHTMLAAYRRGAASVIEGAGSPSRIKPKTRKG